MGVEHTCEVAEGGRRGSGRPRVRPGPRQSGAVRVECGARTRYAGSAECGARVYGLYVRRTASVQAPPASTSRSFAPNASGCPA